MATKSTTFASEDTIEIGQTAIQKALQDVRDSDRSVTLVFASGPNKGRQFTCIAKPGMKHILGRGEHSDVQIEDASISRFHALLFIDQHGIVKLNDLGSSNGTFVNSERLNAETPHPVAGGDVIRLGLVVLQVGVANEDQARIQEDLYYAAVKDPLTGVYNRKYFMEVLEREFALARRGTSGFSIMMFDVDNFKSLNDTYGHPFGDKALVKLVQTISLTLRKEDVLARYGGEEFILLLRNLPISLARKIGDRIRSLSESMKLHHQKQRVAVTVSLGLCSTEMKQYKNESEMLEHVDKLLYKAKSGGRNRLESAADEVPPAPPKVPSSA